MKIRVYIANASDYKEGYVELECDGQPREGEFFSCSGIVGDQLLRNALKNIDSCKAHEQWIFPSMFVEGLHMGFEDAFVVNEVAWYADKDSGTMKCYIALDCDVRGADGFCHSENDTSYEVDESFLNELRTSTENYYKIKL